jgi:hypothetical protein
MSGPEFIIFLAGILATTAIVIVSMAMSHQRKMAEFHRASKGDNADKDQIARLSQEVSELKSLVYQQTLEADSLRQLLRGEDRSLPQNRSEDIIVGRD